MSWSCCKEGGCTNPISKKGWCNKHYLKFYKSDKDYKPQEREFKGEKRNHPFYMLWFERKQGGYLCDEWLDFKTFVEAISPKPDGYFFLIRLDGSKPFGPDNFKWREKLLKRECETNKEWWARKRAARIEANPSMERDRNLKRSFGITRQEYEVILKSQNYVCAICKETEKSIDPRSGSLRKLAVDHCHKSTKIRELLCNRCNTTLGKIDDNIELLQNMISYLEKHKEN